MGAQSIHISCALDRPEVREEVDHLASVDGDGGSAEAIDICFFSELIDDETRIKNIDPGALLGRATVVNYCKPNKTDFESSYVFEAIFRVPRLRTVSPTDVERELLNNYVHTRRRFDITVAGQVFSLSGVYYCQQNTVTSVCAHACLRMALNSIDPSMPFVTTPYLNRTLGIAPPIGNGLTLKQVADVLAGLGFQPFFFKFDETQPDPRYIPTLYSVVESGFPALLVFSTDAPNILHIVPVFGHTLNSDEWHPQATPGYSGPTDALFYSSSAWADHFLAHDDNFGPYFCLSNVAFAGISKSATSAPYSMIPRWVIGLFPAAIQNAPPEVEGLATSWLNGVLPNLKDDGDGRWWTYMMDTSWRYVLRTFLLERNAYELHLRSSEGHDGSRLSDLEIAALLQSLPDRFWISEFSLPSLYTGNKSKLGEVLIEASKPIDPNAQFDSVLAMRAPSLIVKHSGGLNVGIGRASLASHSPLYRRVQSGHEW